MTSITSIPLRPVLGIFASLLISLAPCYAHACQTVLRTSPMRYLKQLRLNRARMLLRKGSHEVTSVSECAHFAGFSHLGRFSADYRRTFGESPSQTLDRLM